MNLISGIAPEMDSNQALRRILWCLWTLLGLPDGGAQGLIPGRILKPVIRIAAGGPSPTPANLLVAENDDRKGALLRNLDANLVMFYGSDEDVTDATGATLKANESVPINFTGPIYIYAPNGHPIAELIEVTG